MKEIPQAAQHPNQHKIKSPKVSVTGETCSVEKAQDDPRIQVMSPELMQQAATSAALSSPKPEQMSSSFPAHFTF